MKVAGLRILHHLVQSRARGRSQPRRHVEMHPRRDFQRRSLQLQRRPLPGIRIPHYFPGIARHLRLVNQNHSDRAFARGFFVLVSPAAVVGEGLALEKLQIIRRRLVDQHQQDFAAHVEALVVVPVIFGCFDAVADEHDVGIDVRLRLLRLVEGDVFVERLQIHGLALLGDEGKLGLGQGRDSDQRNLLHVGSVIAGRLQAIFGKLRGDVFRGNVAAALAGAAAFEQIVRQIAYVPANVLRGDGFERHECGSGQLDGRRLRGLCTAGSAFGPRRAG